MAQLKCNGRLQRSPRVEEEADPQQPPVSRLTEEAEEDQGAGIAYLDILQEILLHMFFCFCEVFEEYKWVNKKSCRNGGQGGR